MRLDIRIDLSPPIIKVKDLKTKTTFYGLRVFLGRWLLMGVAAEMDKLQKELLSMNKQLDDLQRSAVYAGWVVDWKARNTPPKEPT